MAGQQCLLTLHVRVETQNAVLRVQDAQAWPMPVILWSLRSGGLPYFNFQCLTSAQPSLLSNVLKVDDSQEPYIIQ